MVTRPWVGSPRRLTPPELHPHATVSLPRPGMTHVAPGYSYPPIRDTRLVEGLRCDESGAMPDAEKGELVV